MESGERGEWRSTKPSRRDRGRYAGYARETLRKDRRVNIRIFSGDLETIQKKALEEGLPYETVISSLLHKYASGRLREA